ncbi:Heterogeneous nuclear ribonucleoprotein A/B [Toxocara canis]|uniref:Serine/arginine-rich splicing factor 2 n=1 Tax=Toxocara canis TaxID=6265 RepID=A0A0B2UTG7_TOXCA|nr:Heterogeneous nuclear ribonucleoprotein A/B [Toxocara canis]
MRLTTLRAIREAVSTVASNHTIHISNLSWVTSRKQVFDYFSQFGKIKKITIPLDQRFGVHRGYAFVDFEDEQSVKKAFAGGQFHEIDETNVRLSRRIQRTDPKRETSAAITDQKPDSTKQQAKLVSKTSSKQTSPKSQK